jgi:phosphoribosyl-AMP cyclohydrolase
LSEPSWMAEIQWSADGLVPAIAQDKDSGRILMFAFMNRESLARTVETGEAHYWSRSRGRLWHKGEESGHIQRVVDLRLDCDGDVVLLSIEQVGGIACHTGRESCFYRRLEANTWIVQDEVLMDPAEIYRMSTGSNS